jgi:hypothetical protein
MHFYTAVALILLQIVLALVTILDFFQILSLLKISYASQKCMIVNIISLLCFEYVPVICLHLVPRPRICGAIPPLPNMSSWRGA